MAEPENQTLRLLKEIRKVLSDHELRFDQVETKIDLLHSDLSLKIEAVRLGLGGETSLSRLAANGIDKRLAAVENR